MANEEQKVETQATADAAATSEVNDASVDEANAAEAATPTLEELQAAIAATEAKSQENWDKAVRMQAEMDNLRKRQAQELEKAHKYALEKFAGELLPVIDSLEMGLDHAQQNSDLDKLIEGTDLTLKKFAQVLEKFGLEVVDPQGEKFDPEKHQAMSMQPNPDVEPNTVTMVMQKGYLLNGRLLRPAMVMVSS